MNSGGVDKYTDQATQFESLITVACSKYIVILTTKVSSIIENYSQNMYYY